VRFTACTYLDGIGNLEEQQRFVQRYTEFPVLIEQSFLFVGVEKTRGWSRLSNCSVLFLVELTAEEIQKVWWDGI